MSNWDHKPTVKTWDAMIQRCTNPNNPGYKYYGARGILVCDEWRSLSGFVSSMGLRPERTTLERIDNSKGYAPDNCRWASHEEQMRNTSRNVLITIEATTKCLAEWCREFGIDQQTVFNRRHRSGLSWVDALTLPLQRGVKFGKLEIK